MKKLFMTMVFLIIGISKASAVGRIENLNCKSKDKKYQIFNSELLVLSFKAGESSLEYDYKADGESEVEYYNHTEDGVLVITAKNLLKKRILKLHAIPQTLKSKDFANGNTETTFKARLDYSTTNPADKEGHQLGIPMILSCVLKLEM